jgi:HK97 family phage prohead protease
MKIEFRSFGVTAVMAGDEGKITGLAAPFNSQTMIGEKPWGFRESISPGAFAKTIQEADVVLLYNHDSSKPLARKSAGTLTLRESDRGLEIEAQPPDTTHANDLRTDIKAGNIRGMSFGFEVIKEAWTDDDGNPADRWSGTQRELKEVKLIEVSPVTFPAYTDTQVTARDAVSAAREARGGNAPGDGSKPYGDVKYADPGYQDDGKKRYPIDTAAHVKAAWSYVNQADNAELYTSEQLAHIKNAIKAAAKKFDIEINDENAAKLALEWRNYLVSAYRADGPEPYEKHPGEDVQCPNCKKYNMDDARYCDQCGAKLPLSAFEQNAAQMVSDLREALALFETAGVKSLPEKVQQAIQLVANAASRTDETEPAGDATPGTENDDALRASFADALSRGIELGY